MQFFGKTRNGFTLIESLVGIAVFMIIAVSVYQAYTALVSATQVSRLRITATALANERFEIIRNLPYADVGIIGGIPGGRIPRTQNIIRDNTEFVVVTTIRNIDNPADGTFGGVPNDLSPADHKLAELEIFCPLCRNFVPLTFTTWVGPRGLEMGSTNGALFVRVFDAFGQPVPGANVSIINNQANPVIRINDTTDNGGMLRIVDVPPGVEAYEITVSKPGYSSDRTHQTGASGNPNPIKPHATVAVQQLTEISFAIDRTSTLNVSSVTNTCVPVPSISFGLSGSKLIGTNPDVPKYTASHVTDGAGRRTISGLEWDTYNLNLTAEFHDLAGATPLLPFVLNPNSNQSLNLIVERKNPRSVLVTVRDASTRLSLSDATVRLQGTGYDMTLITGRGFVRQTDWSGGPGQNDFVDQTRYFDSDGNIDVANPTGEIKLRRQFGEYVRSGHLTSSTFDTGSVSNFHQILWQPQDQPPGVGPDSVRFQIATNNNKVTWNFLGPDGTANSHYTLANQNINRLHNGDRYLRYRVFLQTASSTWTPTVSDISFTFTSLCIPPGQVLFSGLAAGDYTLTVSRGGYQSFTDTVSVSAPWQQSEVILTP
jgi:prepilin-type N-terminal cleavage/methylation domain-containing protein